MEEKKQKPLAIITGGSGYVGTAITAALAAKGWSVVSLSRTSRPLEGATTYECDVTREEKVRDAVKKIVETHGTIRACIHAAASPLERKSLLAVSDSSFKASFATSVDGAFFLAKAAAPHIEESGVFIGLTTEALEPGRPLPPMGAYAPVKYALRGLLRVLASELGPKGVRVNAVAPGFLPGGLNSDLPKAALDFLAKKTPRNATVGALALLIATLCTDPAAFPSGTSVSFPSQTVTPL